MELLNFIFRLGVVFAIFNFIWFFIEMLYHLIRRRSGQSVQEMYMIKMIKYFFLVQTVFLVGIDDDYVNYNIQQLFICALVLLMYFVGKIRKQQRRQLIFQMQAQQQPRMLQHGFNMRAEVIVIAISMLFFGFFVAYPQFATNAISLWFQSSVSSFQKAPILGFIFNVVGFFFLVSILIKMLNGIAFLISGKPLIQPRVRFTANNFNDQENERQNKDENDFDDYEEIK